MSARVAFDRGDAGVPVDVGVHRRADAVDAPRDGAADEREAARARGHVDVGRGVGGGVSLHAALRDRPSPPGSPAEGSLSVASPRAWPGPRERSRPPPPRRFARPTARADPRRRSPGTTSSPRVCRSRPRSPSHGPPRAGRQGSRRGGLARRASRPPSRATDRARGALRPSWRARRRPCRATRGPPDRSGRPGARCASSPGPCFAREPTAPPATRAAWRAAASPALRSRDPRRSSRGPPASPEPRGRARSRRCDPW